MKQTSKAAVVFLLLVFITLSLMGCGNAAKNNPTNTPIVTSPLVTSPIITSPIITSPILPTGITSATPTATPDMKTTASIVSSAAAFETAISKNGTWIICLFNDLSINKDLVLEGQFTNGKKDTAGKDIIQRKIALYTQDASRNITNRFTLTAPKLTVKSPNASIQHGTFKGDLYVDVKNFELVDATVDGNVYFTSTDIKNSFKMDTTSKITGKQEVKK